MHQRQLYEYNVNLLDPRDQSTDKYKFYTFWSPVKVSSLQISEACAAQMTVAHGLHRDKARFMILEPAVLITDFKFPNRPVEVEA